MKTLANKVIKEMVLLHSSDFSEQ